MTIYRVKGGKTYGRANDPRGAGAAIHSLKTLALVALDMEDAHPLALPEPPGPDQVAAYERHMTAIAQQVNPHHRALLNASLRDYQGGFPDRAGTTCESW